MFIRAIKSIFLSILLLSSILLSSINYANDTNVENLMLPHDNTNNIIPTTTDTDSWKNIINDILKYIKNTLNWFIIVVSLWVFLYIWFRLLTIRWNQEEFKKTIQIFIYSIIWIILISLSWALVWLVSSINF